MVGLYPAFSFHQVNIQNRNRFQQYPEQTDVMTTNRTVLQRLEDAYFFSKSTKIVFIEEGSLHSLQSTVRLSYYKRTPDRKGHMYMPSDHVLDSTMSSSVSVHNLFYAFLIGIKSSFHNLHPMTFYLYDLLFGNLLSLTFRCLMTKWRYFLQTSRTIVIDHLMTENVVLRYGSK